MIPRKVPARICEELAQKYRDAEYVDARYQALIAAHSSLGEWLAEQVPDQNVWDYNLALRKSACFIWDALRTVNDLPNLGTTIVRTVSREIEVESERNGLYLENLNQRLFDEQPDLFRTLDELCSRDERKRVGMRIGFTVYMMFEQQKKLEDFLNDS